jgi:TolB protein
MLCRYRNIYVLLPAVLTLVMMTNGCGLTDSEKQRDTPGPDPEVFPTDRTPAWSPSGDRIAYHHDAGGTEDSTDVSGLYVLDLDTDETRLLVEGSARSPDWRPDGERIAFSTGNIYTIQADGSDLKRVTEFGSSFRPRWSPDGKTISFGRSGSTNEVGVWFAHLRDSSFTRFGWVASPADWSPDGARIVYQNADQLWIGDTSRTDSTQLTENDYVANNDPAWSPNGEWIAWSPSTDDGLAVSVMRADGSNKKRLVEAPAAEPSWAPDSERLVFIKPDPETDRTALWTIRRDGSDLRQLTTPSRNPLN